MSKALVIKGASFLANKVETITLVQPIPCTGIVVSPETATLTTIGSTQQLTVTLSPADTTESLTFVSSNPEIASVNATGLITSHGVGTVTITAMCGNQSATCVCTLTESYVIDDKYAVDNGGNYSNSIDFSANPPKNNIGYTPNTRTRLYYSAENLLGGYRVFSSTAQAGKYAIPIPKGATSMTFLPPDGLRNYTYVVFANSMEQQTYVNGPDGESALGIGNVNSPATTNYPRTISLSTFAAADSYIISCYTPSGGDASTITGKTTVSFV